MLDGTHPSHRRRPRQGRSRATVDAVVEATAQVLRAHGYAGATLRRIADRAGVSVGSIYQYFSSKEGLLAAVMTRHVEELATSFAQAMQQTSSDDIRSRIRGLVSGVILAHRHDPDLHRVLAEEVPRVGSLDAHTRAMRAIEAQVAAVLRAHDVLTAPGREDVVAAVIVSSVDAAVHTVLLKRPELDPDLVEEEVTALVERYLLA